MSRATPTCDVRAGEEWDTGRAGRAGRAADSQFTASPGPPHPPAGALYFRILQRLWSEKHLGRTTVSIFVTYTCDKIRDKFALSHFITPESMLALATRLANQKTGTGNSRTWQIQSTPIFSIKH